MCRKVSYRRRRKTRGRSSEEKDERSDDSLFCRLQLRIPYKCHAIKRMLRWPPLAGSLKPVALFHRILRIARGFFQGSYQGSEQFLPSNRSRALASNREDHLETRLLCGKVAMKGVEIDRPACRNSVGAKNVAKRAIAGV